MTPHLAALFSGTPLNVLSASAAMQNAPAGYLGAIIVGIVAVICLVLALVALVVISLWKIFKKAGRPGWAALVPFYNTVLELEMVSLPLWWVVLMFVPIVNLVIAVMLLHRLAVVFGRGWGFTIGILLLPYIFLPILAFGDAKYKNTYPAAKPMSEAVKWALIGVAACLLVEGFMFRMPSSLQEPTLTSVVGSDGSSSGYALDGDHVYYYDQLLPGADANSFSLQGDYATDLWSVYYNGGAIERADRGSFTVLEGGAYAKDNTHVYYEGDVVPGANPATFKALGDDYAKDATQVFFEGYVIDADAATFQVKSGTLGPKVYYDAKDKNHYYNYGDRAQ